METEILLTEEQMERLKPYEENLQTAFRSSWKRVSTNRELSEVKAVGEEIFGKEPMNDNCGACILRLFARVGMVYFRTKETAPAKEEVRKAKATKATARKMTK